MKSEKEGINRRWTRTILSVKEYSPLGVRGLCALAERTIFVLKPPWYRLTKCTSAAVETALRQRRNGTLQASKRHFVDVETALCRRQAVKFLQNNLEVYKK